MYIQYMQYVVMFLVLFLVSHGILSYKYLTVTYYIWLTVNLYLLVQPTQPTVGCVI